MYCKIDECDRPVENKDTGLCATHGHLERKKKKKDLKPKKKPVKIKSISSKKMAEVNEYIKRKKDFFKHAPNRICQVCHQGGADSIHHSRGKVGYYDEDSRMNNESLLIDTRFWIPIHSFNINPKFGTSCHTYIETHPDFARKIGVTYSRLSNGRVYEAF